jgi:hypothetical protein
LQRATNSCARAERNDITVEVTDPVDQPVAGIVANQNIDPRSTVGPIFVRREGVGAAVYTAVRAEIVVRIKKIAAHPP